MIHIHIRYFASLRETMGTAGESIELPAPLSARDIWQHLHGAAPAAELLVAINQSRSDWDQIVRDGDEVAFFPPITGG